MSEIEEHKRKKERGVSNKEWYERIEDQVARSEQAYLVTINPDGTTEGDWTGGNTSPILGALEWAKFDTMVRMTESEE